MTLGGHVDRMSMDGSRIDNSILFEDEVEPTDLTLCRLVKKRKDLLSSQISNIGRQEIDAMIGRVSPELVPMKD